MISTALARHSLKTRITLAILTIFVVSLWSLAFYASRLLRADMEHLLGEQQFSTVSIIAETINEELALRLRALEGYAAGRITPAILANREAIKTRLAESPTIRSMFNGGVWIAREDGIAVASIPPGRIGTYFGDRDYMVAALKEGKSTISMPIIGKVSKAPNFVMAVPIRDPQGTVIGVLVGVTELNKSSFLDKISEGRYGNSGGYMLVAPQHGLIVTSTDKSRIMQPVPRPGVNPLLDRYIGGYAGSGIVVDSRGMEVLSSAKQIPVAGWLLIARIPAEEAFAPIRAMQRNMLLATIFLTILAASLTLWLLRYQLSPLTAAARTLGAITDGKQALKSLPVASQDEIGELIGGFNSLLKKLGEREDELEEQRVQLADIVTFLPDATLAIDRHKRIIIWNKAIEEMTGVPATEMIGKGDYAYTVPFYGEARPQLMDLVFMDSSEVAARYPTIRRKGNSLTAEVFCGALYDNKGAWVFVKASPLHDRSGQIVGAIEVIRDISDQKKAEAALEEHRHNLEQLVASRTSELAKAKDAAESANVTKDTFLANISHEMRTPLNAVIGLASLAQGATGETKRRDYLDKILFSGKRLNRIIDDLLDLSKIAAGRMEFEITTFSLGKLIENSQSIMAYRAGDKGLELIAAIDAQVPDVLKGDPMRIEQIILNLLGNAIKFTEKGRVELRVGLHARQGDRVCLAMEVEDSGIGMRPAELEHIFEPFTQADATVRRKFGGTGLGLTICKRLAEMMDGNISVVSVAGGGTTFRLMIWLDQGQAPNLPVAESSTSHELPQRYRDVNVLVAEDQPLNREIVAELLAAVGVVPRMVENGQDAIDILTGAGPDAFDLVLMDVQMPVMDGLTATRAIRARMEFASLPIIGMTAHTMEHERRICAEAGMNDHIGKPFDNPHFYSTLAKWLPRGKQEERRTQEELFKPPEPSSAAETAGGLHGLRDVDVQSAMSRFGGNEDRLRHWLADFVATAGEIPAKIRSELSTTEGRDRAAKTVHAFKGRVGMLGMTKLHDEAATLESSLRADAPLDELLSGLENAIADMRRQVALALGLQI